MNWDNYIENFKYHLKIERGLSENSIKSYVYDINKFCKFLINNNIKLSPTDINIDLIKEFLYVNSGKIKSRSQSRQISSLKSFFGYLVFENIIKILKTAPGCKVIDERKDGGYITPIEAEGDYTTYISRIRKDNTNIKAINLWVVSDNLLKGAALNTVQIAECLMKKK